VTQFDNTLEEWEVLDLLTSLVDKSLVVYEEDEQGMGRYRLLETVRQYARGKLVDASQSELVRQRHSDYFLGWSEASMPHLLEPEPKAWYVRFEAEHDNLRAALDWCLGEAATTGTDETALRFCASLGMFWWGRSYLSEGYHYFLAALTYDPTPQPTVWRARSLSTAALCAQLLGDLQRARSLQTEALAIATKFGDKESIASGYNRLGTIALEECDFAAARSALDQAISLDVQLRRYAEASGSMAVLAIVSIRQGDIATAKAQADEAFRLARTGSHVHVEAMAGMAMGYVRLYLEDHDAARNSFEQALELLRANGVRAWEPWALEGLGRVALSQREHERARADLNQAIELCRVSQHGAVVEVRCLTALAYVEIREQDYQRARELLWEALRLLHRSGSKWEVICALEAVVAVDVRVGHMTAAARLSSAAQAQRSHIGSTAVLTPWIDGDGDLATIRAALDDAAFAAAWQAGQAMTLEQAVEYALSESEAA